MSLFSANFIFYRSLDDNVDDMTRITDKIEKHLSVEVFLVIPFYVI